MSEAALLDLELKLYALRHPEALAAWAERYRSMHRAETFADEFGLVQEQDNAQIAARIFALSANKTGIILAMQFCRMC